MSRVIHFEIPASNPERASAFYKKVFGWKSEPIPTVGYFAYLEDTEGNLFGVMQADQNAK